MPPILIISLKRFKYSQNNGKKVTKRVTFPISGLRLENVLSSTQKDAPEYDLFARIDHSGTLSDGHYYSVVKNIKN